MVKNQFVKSCGAVVFRRVGGQVEYLLVNSLEGVHGFPKGRMLPGESETQTALREVKEETGLSVELIDGFHACEEYSFVDENGCVRSKKVVYFLAECRGQTPMPQPEEISAILFAHFDEALCLLERDGRKTVLKAANAHLVAHTI